MEFASRDDVKIWIIRNQLGRRNLNKYVRSELVLQFKSIIAERSKERMLAGVKVEDPGLKSVQGSSEEISQSDKNRAEVQRKTASQLAAMADVSRDTIAKVEKIQQQASPEIKAALRTGDLSINAAYEGVKAGATTADFSVAKYSVREEFSRFFCYPPVRAHSGIFRSGVTAFEKEKDLACAMR